MNHCTAFNDRYTMFFYLLSLKNNFIYLLLYLLIQIWSHQNHKCNTSNVFLPFLVIIMRGSVARHTERNYGICMLKLWYTMVHVYKTHARREIQINISSNTSKFNIFHKWNVNNNSPTIHILYFKKNLVNLTKI